MIGKMRGQGALGPLQGLGQSPKVLPLTLPLGRRQKSQREAELYSYHLSPIEEESRAAPSAPSRSTQQDSVI